MSRLKPRSASGGWSSCLKENWRTASFSRASQHPAAGAPEPAALNTAVPRVGCDVTTSMPGPTPKSESGGGGWGGVEAGAGNSCSKNCKFHTWVQLYTPFENNRSKGRTEQGRETWQSSGKGCRPESGNLQKAPGSPGFCFLSHGTMPGHLTSSWDVTLS